ncbi:hypothetical protein BHYA_0083g00240 [Botrytis hyacinthi]|uniref:Uncharacterized protein n=1 Tax=Botrytis hyacinthi TaxID=278943 RepID=A0A4Z1GMX1_9HELO|nr:hypothetical protein BHYA_0083g00240 [Botrytis hyacinthi]
MQLPLRKASMKCLSRVTVVSQVRKQPLVEHERYSNDWGNPDPDFDLFRIALCGLTILFVSQSADDAHKVLRKAYIGFTQPSYLSNLP